MIRVITLVSALFFVHLPSGAHPSRGGKQLRHPRIPYEPCRDQEPGKFVKDRYACDKFFYCGLNHTAISVNCPHGMVFNDLKDICDFPWNFNCVAEKREDDRTTTAALTTTSIPTSTRTTTTPSTKSTLAPKKNRPTRPTRPTTHSHSRPPKHQNRCPKKDSDKLLFLAEKRDCRRYYICYHGHPMPQHCGAGLHWNQRMRRCDLPEKAGCAHFTSTTVMPPVVTTTESVVKNPMNCPVRGEYVLPHPEECNHFIYCVNGFPILQQCPFFHHFDVMSKSCVWQTVARCIVSMKSGRAERG